MSYSPEIVNWAGNTIIPPTHRLRVDLGGVVEVVVPLPEQLPDAALPDLEDVITDKNMVYVRENGYDKAVFYAVESGDPVRRLNDEISADDALQAYSEQDTVDETIFGTPLDELDAYAQSMGVQAPPDGV